MSTEQSLDELALHLRRATVDGLSKRLLVQLHA
jgi:hypothetical protein